MGRIHGFLFSLEISMPKEKSDKRNRVLEEALGSEVAMQTECQLKVEKKKKPMTCICAVGKYRVVLAKVQKLSSNVLVAVHFFEIQALTGSAGVFTIRRRPEKAKDQGASYEISCPNAKD